MSAPGASSPSQARSVATLVFFSGLNIIAAAGVELANLKYFGAGWQKDAYDTAYFIPTMLIYLFGLDVWRGLSTALFSRLSVNETEERWGVFSSIVTIMVTIGGALCVACFFLAPWLVSVVAPGYAADPRAPLCVQLLRLNLPVILLLSLTGFFDSVLIAHHVYGWSSLSQVMLKVAQVLAVVGWAGSYGIRVLPIGTIIGLSFAMIAQTVMLRRHGIHYRLFYCDWQSPKLRLALRQVGPLFLSIVVAQLAALCVQNLATRGIVGTVACLNYAIRFVGIISQLVVQPLSTSYAPRIARLVELSDHLTARELTVRSVTWLTYCTWTIALVVMLACEPLLLVVLPYTRLTPDNVGLLAFFMRILVLVGWCRGLALHGIYFGLARGASWRVFLVNFCDAVVLGVSVVSLTALAGVYVALPTATLLGAAAGGVAGLSWLEAALGGIVRVVVRRIAGWAAVVLGIGLLVGVLDALVRERFPDSPPSVHALLVVIPVLALVPTVAIWFRMPEVAPAFQRLYRAVLGRLRLRPS
jgi:peptidoglycan biosynthesis protein MviN/MurJ (putative lipid II flippase)